jgi:hypothetical protein
MIENIFCGSAELKNKLIALKVVEKKGLVIYTHSYACYITELFFHGQGLLIPCILEQLNCCWHESILVSIPK